jgi:hypothetical protein
MKLLDRIRNHPAVESVSDEREWEGGVLFVYLADGWEWSEQRSFGCETVSEAWSLTKAARKVE